MKEVYVMKVKGQWCGFMPRPKMSIIFNAQKGVELPEFITDIREELADMGIDVKFRCIVNRGIENHILSTLKNNER